MNYEKIIKEISNRDKNLKKDIEVLINKYNYDAMTDTPDFVLAEYLMNCLRNYLVTKYNTEEWFGKRITINGVEEIDKNE